MSKIKIIPVLTFTLGLLSTTIIGTAYLHAEFATKGYVKELKMDVSKQLDRIENKLDKIMERR